MCLCVLVCVCACVCECAAMCVPVCVCECAHPNHTSIGLITYFQQCQSAVRSKAPSPQNTLFSSSNDLYNFLSDLYFSHQKDSL